VAASFSYHAQGGGIWPDGAGMPDPQPQALRQPTRHLSRACSAVDPVGPTSLVPLLSPGGLSAYHVDDLIVCEPLRSRGGRRRHRWLRGLRPQGDEHEDPCDRDQDPEQVALAVAGVAQSDGHGEVR